MRSGTRMPKRRWADPALTVTNCSQKFRCTMPEMIWLNGETMPLAEARINVEDRGFQFADGVYEVVRLYNGRPFTLTEHLDRLERSAAGIVLPSPLGRKELASEIERFAGKHG